MSRALPALLAALLVAACDGDRPPPAAAPAPPPSPAAASAARETRETSDDRSYVFPAPERLVAIGDVHGDLAATRAALRLAGAIDESDRWIGGKLVVVQTGDQLDRGDEEQAILDLFARLADDARAAGGAVHALNGNHEIMNVQGDFRYVTEGGFADFEDVTGLDLASPKLARLPPPARSRGAAFLPGAPYATKLAARNVIVMIGDTVFAHGGVLPAHVKYGVTRINREVQAWMEAKSPAPPAIVTAEDSPVWTRLYGGDANPSACQVLDQALAALSAKRMVVGHTVQKGGITPGCDDKVWRIDVGLARHYGGRPAVLEIAGDRVRILAPGAN